jgi:hypothetical protein
MIARDDWKEGTGLLKTFANEVARRSIDWDFVLRMGNTWFDRLAAASDKPTRAERQSEMAKIDRELKELRDKFKDWDARGFPVFPMLLRSRETNSQGVGKVLLDLLLPAPDLASNSEDRANTRFEVNQLAFALAAYRADRGAYPDKLAALTPTYRAKLPQDPFGGFASAYHYRREGDGFLLYSVGMNGRDDGGKDGYDAEEAKGNKDWDDITVRVPARNGA